MTRYVVVGGGIVGAATAHRILLERPGAHVTVLEKETRWAAHQTGRNSGVIHAGVYYPPGSMKARFSRAGSESMVQFCRDHGLAHDVCGKLIIATDETEVPRLRALHERALANGLPVRLQSPEEAREHEPYVRCQLALFSPTTGIVDYGQVTETLVRLCQDLGGDMRLGESVQAIVTTPGGSVVVTSRGEHHADVLVNCAGLHSDHVARMAGLEPAATIVPFRGEYYELVEDRRYLVKNLVYPVPDPEFPFLGVHLTRSVDGGIHAGPNAVLALAREGYTWGTVDTSELWETLRLRGFWQLARSYYRTGAAEMLRSASTAQFARSLSRLVPGIESRDLVKAAAGVRAQAVSRDGRLVDDFVIQTVPGQVHVLNAPSPAATASLEIAKVIASNLRD